MNWIKNKEELKGAVIQRAVQPSSGTMWVLFLDGDRAVAFESSEGDDVWIAGEIGIATQREIGVMDPEEYQRRKDEIAAKTKAQTREREMKELARLKAKYPDEPPAA